MMGHFLWTCDPGRSLGYNYKAELAEPSTEPVLKQRPFINILHYPRETLRRMCRTVWDSKEPFGRRKPFAAKKAPEDKHVLLPKTFTMAEDAKANTLGEKWLYAYFRVRGRTAPNDMSNMA